jgi:hypothetical protein
MSKKRFSSGLDDLFSEAAAAQHLGGIEAAVFSAPAMERKTPSHKNFASGLDALLQEALEESLERYESNQPDTTTPSSAKSRAQRSSSATPAVLSGLDALIRQTIDVQEISHDEASGKKRLTVAVDRSKLDKLKVIARLENAYLKDLLVNLIDGYIEEYAQEKGVSL